jgi:pimeloyl-ACP methyl ester carboxylesterase
MPIVDVGGCRIRYETWGEGPSVALLHGFTSFIEQNWLERGWVELLTDAGHQVIGVDLRGHGRSSKPSRPEDYETALLASDVVRVFDELGVARSDVSSSRWEQAWALRLAVVTEPGARRTR